MRCAFVYCEKNVRKHVCSLFLRIHYVYAVFSVFQQFYDLFGNPVLEIAPRWLKILLARSAVPLLEQCRLFQERFLPLKLMIIDDPDVPCRFKGHDHAVGVLVISCMHLDHDHRNIEIGIRNRLMEVLAYDHAGTRPDNSDSLRMPELGHFLKQCRKQLAPAKDEIGLIHRCCDHSQVILLEQAGVLERASRRSVQDRNVCVEIAQRVERRNDRARTRVHYLDVSHYVTCCWCWY